MESPFTRVLNYYQTVSQQGSGELVRQPGDDIGKLITAYELRLPGGEVVLCGVRDGELAWFDLRGTRTGILRLYPEGGLMSPFYEAADELLKQNSL